MEATFANPRPAVVSNTRVSWDIKVSLDGDWIFAAVFFFFNFYQVKLHFIAEKSTETIYRYIAMLAWAQDKFKFSQDSYSQKSVIHSHLQQVKFSGTTLLW